MCCGSAILKQFLHLFLYNKAVRARLQREASKQTGAHTLINDAHISKRASGEV